LSEVDTPLTYIRRFVYKLDTIIVSVRYSDGEMDPEGCRKFDTCQLEMQMQFNVPPAL